MNRIVIVTGMHRAGTCPVAGLLHHNGIPFGRDEDFIPKPSKINPEGFFENVYFRTLNDDLLAEFGYNVKQWHKPIPFFDVNALENWMGYVKRGADLLLEFKEIFYGKMWGVRDPRFCLTWKFWEPIMDLYGFKPFVIGVFRNTQVVAKSMVSVFKITYERALEIEREYSMNALQMSHLAVNFDDLLDYPEKTCDLLTAKLAYPVKPHPIVKKEHRHFTASDHKREKAV